MKSPVQLYLRVRLPNGTYPYLKAAFASNGRIRPNHAMHNGRAVEFPATVYHLRYCRDGRRVWEPAGTDSSRAMVALQRKTQTLQGIAGEDPSVAKSEAEPVKRLLADCVASYIAETKEHKSAKTFAAYRLTVLEFCAVMTGISIEDSTDDEDFIKSVATKGTLIEGITRENILGYSASLKKRGCSARTIRNRIDHLQIFLHHFKLPSLLKGKDLPKFTKKKVRAYNSIEIGKMFSCATRDEADLLCFFLCTGAREQEAQDVCWADVVLERKTYTTTEHPDMGYIIKDREEGTLPMPDLLVDALIARRKRYPKTRLIFPGKFGGPNGHALRSIKRLALRAGVNCGQCVNKAGKSCATHPVCTNVFLHKVRKSFASFAHHKGLPAQTIQRYLRHSELSTTLLYLADEPDDLVRTTINSTFSGFGGRQLNAAPTTEISIGGEQ